MKTLKSLTICLMLLSVSLNPSMAAEKSPLPRPDCAPAVQECAKVIIAAQKDIEDKQKQIDIRDLALKQSLGALSDANKRVADTESELGRFYRNPFVMVAVGLVVGGFIMGVARK